MTENLVHSYTKNYIKIPFFLKGVDGSLTQLTSMSVMMRNGWLVDVDYSNGEDQMEEKEEFCDFDQFYGYKEANKVGRVSAIFKGSGKANLRYANCFTTGYVTVSLNGHELDRTLYDRDDLALSVSEI